MKFTTFVVQVGRLGPRQSAPRVNNGVLRIAGAAFHDTQEIYGEAK